MTVIYFAGAEIEASARALLEAGVKNVLYSFYYILTMNREGLISKLQREYPAVNWFLDSGAFTFVAAKREKKVAMGSAHAYVEKYFEYIQRCGDKYNRIAEPDLDDASSGVEKKVTVAWLEKMLKMWPNYPIMPVWHPNRKKKFWDSYCTSKEIKHIGISGIADIGVLRRMVSMAHSYGKTVHGFAGTKMDVLQKVPFDSVDSTTWISGQKYGVIYVWQGNRFISIDRGRISNIPTYKRYLNSIGCDTKKIMKYDVDTVRKCNIHSWRILAEKLEEKAKAKSIKCNDGEDE